MTHCTLLVSWILTEESLFSKNIASSYHVTNFLKIIVSQSDHKASIEHEVNIVYVVALPEQHLIFIHNSYLRAFDDKLVSIVADFSKHLMVQPDPL